MSLAYMKPVVWSVQDGILVRDLKKSDCKAALDFLKKWHLTSSVLLHTFNVKHCCSSLMSFFQIVYYIMKDETSLLAIDDDTQEIVGVLVGKPMIRENWSWNFFRMLLPTNYVSQIIGNFERDMVMAHVPNAEHRDPPSSYHVFAICLSPAYKGRNQKPRFLIDAYKVARSLGLPKLSFIGKSLNDQIRASRIGMTEITKTCYGDYVDSNGEKLIKTYPSGQYYAIHFEMDVGPKCNMSTYERRIE